MMNKGKKRGIVSVRQLQILLFLDIFGTGVIAAPGIAARFASNDCWLVIIGATFLALCYSLIINSLAEMFPMDTFPAYSMKIVGKPAGVVLSALLAARIILSSGIELRIFTEIVRHTLLFKTPIWVIAGAMAGLSAYLIHLGYETRARLAEIMLIPIMAPLMLVFLAAFANADISNILPAFKTAPSSILGGSFYLSFLFRRLELALLVYPLANKPGELKKGQMKAIAVTGLLMLFAAFVTLLRFGAEDIKTQIWPVLRLADTLSFPGGFFERVDAFVISLWIFSVLISTSAAVYFPSEIFGASIRGRNEWLIIISAALVFGISLAPENASDAYSMLSALDLTLGALFLIIIPILLHITARLRGKRRAENATE